jgi:hypothetical protein
MATIPTLKEEDARRPSREREDLISERTRIVNRMKACLARLGIRTFKPTVRQAPDQLSALHTPEGVPVPPNTLDELQRDIAQLHFVMAQIKGPRRPVWNDCSRRRRNDLMPWCACSPGPSGLASRRRTCW